MPSTLLRYLLKPIKSRGGLDDLAHIQLEYTRHPFKTEEPKWVWLLIGCLLKQEFRRAIDQKDGIRICMLEALATQLDHELQRHGMQSFTLGMVSNHEEELLNFGHRGYLAFIMAARYFKSLDKAIVFSSAKEYRVKLGMPNYGIFKRLEQWVADIPLEVSLLVAAASNDLIDLRYGMQVWMFQETERTSGHTLTILWDKHPDSWFKDEMITFLQMPNGEMVFDPYLYVDIDMESGSWGSGSCYLKMQGVSEGYVTDVPSLLEQWVVHFLKKDYIAAMDRYTNKVLAMIDAEKGVTAGGSTGVPESQDRDQGRASI